MSILRPIGQIVKDTIATQHMEVFLGPHSLQLQAYYLSYYLCLVRFDLISFGTITHSDSSQLFIISKSFAHFSTYELFNHSQDKSLLVIQWIVGYSNPNFRSWSQKDKINNYLPQLLKEVYYNSVLFCTPKIAPLAIVITCLIISLYVNNFSLYCKNVYNLSTHTTL